MKLAAVDLVRDVYIGLKGLTRPTRLVAHLHGVELTIGEHASLGIPPDMLVISHKGRALAVVPSALWVGELTAPELATVTPTAEAAVKEIAIQASVTKAEDGSVVVSVPEVPKPQYQPNQKGWRK